MLFLKTILIFSLVIRLTACGYADTKVTGAEAVTDTLEMSLPVAVVENRPKEIVLVKDFLYDNHTLEDTYPYKDGTREFQWDKIRDTLRVLEAAQSNPIVWATLQNYKNLHGVAPMIEAPEKDEYNTVTDRYGVSRYQSIPLYEAENMETPIRYARDGALVRFLQDSLDFVKICSAAYDGEWYVPEKYVKVLSVSEFTKVIFVDRANQNIATTEKGDSVWYIRSMNPATTGLHRPPYQQETPLGIFVIQEKKPRMYYTHDGSSEMAGYAPYASRFTRGGYIHAVPLNNVNATERDYIEFSSSLGTTPRSHMCVRNATSHAKFVYDWAPALESLVVVLE